MGMDSSCWPVRRRSMKAPSDIVGTARLPPHGPLCHGSLMVFSSTLRTSMSTTLGRRPQEQLSCLNRRMGRQRDDIALRISKDIDGCLWPETSQSYNWAAQGILRNVRARLVRVVWCGEPQGRARILIGSHQARNEARRRIVRRCHGWNARLRRDAGAGEEPHRLHRGQRHARGVPGLFPLGVAGQGHRRSRDIVGPLRHLPSGPRHQRGVTIVSRQFLKFMSAALVQTVAMAILLQPKNPASGLALFLLVPVSGWIVRRRRPSREERNPSDRGGVALLAGLLLVPLSLWVLFRLFENGTIQIPNIPEPPLWLYRTLMVVVWSISLRFLWRQAAEQTDATTPSPSRHP